jgi:hypothetical protein
MPKGPESPTFAAKSALNNPLFSHVGHISGHLPKFHWSMKVSDRLDDMCRSDFEYKLEDIMINFSSIAACPRIARIRKMEVLP